MPGPWVKECCPLSRPVKNAPRNSEKDMTRRGKIARLPRGIREQVNRRLDDGQEAKGVAEWLNGLPEVAAVMAEEFGGEPISESNLSQWKTGGYADWEAQEEKRERVRQLTEEALELGEDADGMGLAERLAVVAAAELVLSMREGLNKNMGPEERRKWLMEVLREIARLRREDNRRGYLELARERRRAEQAEAAKKTEARRRWP